MSILSTGSFGALKVVDELQVLSTNAYFAGNIVTSGNVVVTGNIVVDGPVEVDSLVFIDTSSNNTITLSAPTLTGSYSLTLPIDDGMAGQVLSTNGSGVLSWSTDAAGVPMGPNLSVQFNNGGVFGGNAALTFNNVSNTLILTGSVKVDGMELKDPAGSNTITIIAPSLTTGNYSLTLPVNDGGVGEFLQTDGSGVLIWAAAGGSPGGANTQIQFNNAGAFGGSSSFIWNDTSTSLEVDGKIVQTNTIDPVILSTLIDAVNLNGPFDVFVSGNYAYVASFTSDSLTIIDVTDPTITPIVVGTLFDSVNLNGASRVYVQGKYAYMTAAFGTSRFTIIDVSNPVAPLVVSSITGIGSFANGLHVDGKYAYTTSEGSNIFSVIDISNPLFPVIVGSVVVASDPYGIYVVGIYVYVASDGGDSLSIIDVSDPTNPSISSTVTDVVNLNGARSLVVIGKYAYIACAAGDRMSIFNVEDPTATPVFVSTVALSSRPTNIKISGIYAYIASFVADAFDTVDISDPTTPVLVSTIISTNLDGDTSVFISGRYAYVTANNAKALNIIDIHGNQLSSVTSGNIKTNSLDVMENMQVGGSVSIRSGLQVNNSLAVLGDLSVNGSFNINKVTGTEAANVVTVSASAGVITTSSLTTVAASSYLITWTNTYISTTSVIIISLMGGTNTTPGVQISATAGSGSSTITITNNDTGAAALNGTLILGFLIL